MACGTGADDLMEAPRPRETQKKETAPHGPQTVFLCV
jgi:hypothetical protein